MYLKTLPAVTLAALFAGQALGATGGRSGGRAGGAPVDSVNPAGGRAGGRSGGLTGEETIDPINPESDPAELEPLGYDEYEDTGSTGGPSMNDEEYPVEYEQDSQSGSFDSSDGMSK